MHDETTVEATRWRMVRELEKARDAAEETLRYARWGHERAEELATRAEDAIRERNREEVAEWARGVLEDPETVITALGTTGLDDPVDVVEAALYQAGEEVFHERVRPTVEIEEGAAAMHGHTAETLEDAPTFSEIYPRLREVLERKRMIAYNSEYVSRVLAQTFERYGLEPQEAGIECAMKQYARVAGEWSVEAETYRPVALPNADGTPEGNTRALHALLVELAGFVPVSPGSGGRGGRRRAVTDAEPQDDDFDSIPF